MAVDQLLLDDIAATVAQLYREAESALTQQIADRLRKDMDHPYAERKLVAVRHLQRSARTILATLNNRAADTIRQSIADAYRNGWGSALEDLPKAWFAKSGIGQDAARGREDIPNTAAIESIAAAVVQDIGEKSRNVLRDVVDAYRAVQTAAAARVLAGIQTRRQASQSAWQRLVDQGITGFTDRAGRRWRLSSYVEMVARTNAQRAAVQAQTDRLTSLGVDLVIVSDAPQECRICRPYEHEVLRVGTGPTGWVGVQHATKDNETVSVRIVDTVAGAMAKGLLHPNCRHSLSAYLPGVTRFPMRELADPDGDVARQRQRAIERNIRKHKERSAAALTPEAKQQADARVREWQKELRNHLAAHPDLKRLRYRERIGAGNIPGAGGPNGGPTGAIGPDKQPTLDGGPGAKPTAPKADQSPPADGKAPGQQDLLKVKPEAVKPASKAPSKPVVKKPESAPKAIDPKVKAEHEAAVRKRAAEEEAKIRERYQPQIDAARRELEAAQRDADLHRQTGGHAFQQANARRFAAQDRVRSLERHQAAELKKNAARHDAELNRPPGTTRPDKKPTQLDKHVASGEASREKLGGGMIAETSIVHFKDGSKAVHKRAEDNGWADAIHQTDAEELGALVARKLGLASPKTHKSAPDEIYLEFMDGKIGNKAKKPKEYWLSDDGRRMALLDQLIDYPDRHDANWLMHNGRLISIDHGIAFTYSHSNKGKPRAHGEPNFRYVGPFEKLFLKRPREGDPTEWGDNDLSPEDIADVRRTLDSLRRDFEDAGRTEWHDRMSQVLDKIAEHAKGTKRWLPALPDPGNIA